MSQKPTAPFHYTIPSGPLLWSDWVKTHSPSTHQSVLDPDHPPGLTVKVRNAGCDILCFHGIGPISSWVDDHLFFHIRHSSLPEYNKQRRAWSADITVMRPTSARRQTVVRRSSFEDGTTEQLTKTVASHAKISLSDQPAHQKIPYIPTTSTTLISPRTNSGYLGSYQRTCLSLQLPLTSDSTGILRLTKYPWTARRKKNTSELQKNGCRTKRTLSKRSKNSTVSSYIPAWLSRQDEHTSPNWRLCSGSSMTVLLTTLQPQRPTH